MVYNPSLMTAGDMPFLDSFEGTEMRKVIVPLSVKAANTSTCGQGLERF